MSTSHMPHPPDRPANQASPEGSQTQPTAANADIASQSSPPEASSAPPTTNLSPEQAQMPLSEDMARILTEQAEVIVQRMMYHSQLMVGVSALGTDPVSVRNATLAVANALRNGSTGNIEGALVNLGDPQLQQVNDHTLPFKFNAQVAGLFEGILLDTLKGEYSTDAGRNGDARALLETVFLDANEEAEKQHKAQLAFLAPGPHPNARK